MARKILCDTCNIDKKCDCQEDQISCNNCGMEGVVLYNKYLKSLDNYEFEEENVWQRWGNKKLKMKIK